MLFEYTTEELNQVEASFFESTDPMVLNIYPSKLKKQWLVLLKISSQFDENRQYSEKEVNAILEAIYFDYVTIRRSLIDYKFLQRTRDGRAYWLNPDLIPNKKS